MTCQSKAKRPAVYCGGAIEPIIREWFKVKTGANYANVSERTFRDWLKSGLRHSRLKTGTILIRRQWIDEYLTGFEVVENKAEKITDEVCSELL